MMRRIVANLMLAGVIAVAIGSQALHAQDSLKTQTATTQSMATPTAPSPAAPPLTLQPLRPSPNALPAVQAPAVVAQDNSCAGRCQTEHDQCRVQTKGSPNCDAARQRCLQACIASKKARP